jgi:hypothetical protein
MCNISARDADMVDHTLLSLPPARATRPFDAPAAHAAAVSIASRLLARTSVATTP